MVGEAAGAACSAADSLVAGRSAVRGMTAKRMCEDEVWHAYTQRKGGVAATLSMK